MTESSTVTTTWQSLARRTALITGIAGALALTLAVSLALSWRGTLPDPVASHWGADGHPDGFSTVTGFLAIPLALGVLLLVGAVAAILVWGKSAAVRRVNAGAGVWVTSVLALTLVSSLAIQRHLADATTAAQPVWLMAVIFIIPFVPAVAVAVLVPRDPPRPATAVPPEGVPRWELGGGERAVWFERTGGGTSAIILVVVTAGLTISAVLTRSWGMLVVPACLLVLLLAMTQFSVRVDVFGLTVRSALGWPRAYIPADEIERADVVEVNPFAEFGGWGWRVGRNGRTGVVLRTGPALQVTQSGDRCFVITVDDAGTAAALLNTYAGRAR